MHDLCRVIDVLDGVLCLGFFEDGGGGDALCGSELGHDVGFDEGVVSGAAGHDDARSYAGLVLADAFEDAFALLGGGGAVGSGGSAEDDEGVEVVLGGVVGGESYVVACDDESKGESGYGEGEEDSV